MATKNDITGDTISTKHNSDSFVNNYDLIDWGKKDEKPKKETDSAGTKNIEESIDGSGSKS